MRYLNYRIGVPILAALCLILAIAWAKHRDPFRRIEFSLKTAHYGKVKAVAVLPKPAARFPVVIYVHGSGGSLMTDGKALRQIADLGMAAVGIEYDQTNQAAFDEQFTAVHNFVQSQPWAQSNATAWVGMSLGAQRTLRFALNHPQVQPQLLVRLSGGWEDDLSGKFQVSSVKINDRIPERSEMSKSSATLSGLEPFSGDAAPGVAPRILPQPRANIWNPVGVRTDSIFRCPVLLVHSDNDTTFPVADAKHLAALLETNGVPVSLRILPGAGHDFGENRALVYREMAEYCRAHLGLADYTATLSNCEMSEAERRRFNLAMQRAGQNRRELWDAVASAKEPERHTMITVIGGLEDYDLAHMSASYLKRNVRLAWQARRAYPWSGHVPLDIFERFAAGPRFYSEPIVDWRGPLKKMVQHEVKYCRTTQEASDRVWSLINEKVAWGNGPTMEPLKILEAGKTDCLGLCITHVALGRAVGLAERVTRIIWQNSLEPNHYCAEIWNAGDQRWHEIDVSAQDRAFNNDWILRVPKTAILGPTGDRGVWNALSVGDWSSFTNTIGLVYPSGDVLVKVADHGVPISNRAVGIQLPTVKGLVNTARIRMDQHGEARFTLGKSQKVPYRFFVLPQEQSGFGGEYLFPGPTAGEETWQWVKVQAGEKIEVVLNIEDRRPFDPEMTPPSLSDFR